MMTDQATEIERLYEDESLTDELDDDSAQPLLAWAEGKIGTLEEDDTLETRAKAIRQLIKRVNRLVGKRSYEADETIEALLQELVSFAVENGYSLDSAQVSAQLPADSADMVGGVHAILALLDGGTEDVLQSDPPVPSPTGSTPPQEQPTGFFGRLSTLIQAVSQPKDDVPTDTDSEN